MESDFKEVVDSVRADLRDVESRLAARIGSVESSVGSVESRLDSVESKLRQELREEGITTRRHFDVVAEGLRDDIRLIAEGVIALDAKVEAMRRA